MASCDNFAYMMLNLVGEVGEFASKVAKQIRKENVTLERNNLHVTLKGYDALHGGRETASELKKEAGDILWQLAGLCRVMDWDLEDVAQGNLDKLAARKAAGTIDGSGDGIIRGK
jgi:NTP pyrophosphatase (non-canonical NTP hydrolase)